VAVVKEDSGGFSEANPVLATGREQMLLNRLFWEIGSHFSQVRAPESLPCVVIDCDESEV